LHLLATPRDFQFCGEEERTEGLRFVLALANQLSGQACGCVLQVDHYSRDDNVDKPADAATLDWNNAVAAAIDTGAPVVSSAAWCDLGERTIDAPPFDHYPQLRRCGVAIDVWRQLHQHNAERRSTIAWPPLIDVDSFYANLPDSLSDLYSSWRAGRDPGQAP
jgi:hypothetical protein